MKVHSFLRFFYLLGGILMLLLLLSSLLGLMQADNIYTVSLELSKTATGQFTYGILIDWISVSFSFLVLFISSNVFYFAKAYMSSDIFSYRFGWLLFSFVISMNLLVYANSFLALMVGWDGLGLTSFLLIIYYSSNSSLTAGFLTLMTNRLGDVLIMLSVIFFINAGNFLLWPYQYFSWLPFTMLLVAAMTKSAQVPFSSWLPAAMAAPTPVSALVHSSTLVTAGIFLLIRFSMNLNLDPVILECEMLVGALTSLLGGVAAFYENDIKKIIALSTLSQLGLMMFCLGLNLPSLALLHLFTHATFKALMFLAAGLILSITYGAQDLRIMGAITFKYPLLLVLFNTSGLCLVGAPFLSAFYSKHMILDMMCSSSLSVLSLLIMILSIFFTSLYVLRLVKILSWSKISSCGVTSPVRVGEVTPMVLMSMAAIMSGKLFTLLFLGFKDITFTPAWWGVMWQSLLGMGMVVAFAYSTPKNSPFLSSLWALEAITSKLRASLTLLQRPVLALERGWLEPSTYLQSSLSLFSGLSTLHFFTWPKFKQLSINTSILFIFLFIIILWLF